MSTKHQPTNAQDPIGGLFDDVVEQIAESFTVGTDREGYTHHFYAPADVVVVYDESGVGYWEHLDGSLLDSWVSYVEEKRGWLSFGPFADLGIEADRRRKEGE